MQTPTHDEIALCAHQLWHARGCPDGIDVETWLEAERQLAEAPPADIFAARDKAEIIAENAAAHPFSPAGTEQEAIKADLLKQDARAPQLAHHQDGPRSRPAPPGKPVWSRPHSS